jgi:hypothetical protein
MVALSNAGLLAAVQDWVAGQDATTLRRPSISDKEFAMLLASTALGRLALGQEIDASATTTILTAATGNFALTGKVATFQIQEVVAEGSFTLTGEAAAFQTQEAAAFARLLTLLPS